MNISLVCIILQRAFHNFVFIHNVAYIWAHIMWYGYKKYLCPFQRNLWKSPTNSRVTQPNYAFKMSLHHTTTTHQTHPKIKHEICYPSPALTYYIVPSSTLELQMGQKSLMWEGISHFSFSVSSPENHTRAKHLIHKWYRFNKLSSLSILAQNPNIHKHFF